MDLGGDRVEFRPRLVYAGERSSNRGNKGRRKGAGRVASLTVENYVKTIYLIASREVPDRIVATGELAQALNVSPGTVTGMLKTLSEAGLASYTPYEGVRLSPQGERLALKVLRRHRLLELFLVQTLQMHWDEVHEEAEHMEHAVSESLIDRIDAFLNHPSVDPHGDPIPKADGSLDLPSGRPLNDLDASERFRIARVVDQDPSFLRYLTDCGLDLGAEGIVAENRSESGAMVVQVGDHPIALGREAAGKVIVTSIS